MNTHTIFSSFFAESFFKDINNEVLKKYILQLKKKEKGLQHSNEGGWHSAYFNLDQEPFLHLHSKIKEQVSILARDMGIKITPHVEEAWALINNYKDYNKVHCHPHTTFAGVYYISVPPKSGNIIFYNPAIDGIQSHWYEYNITRYNTFTSSKFTAIPSEGSLMLFPSFLKHEVGPNLNKDPRIALAFNI